MREQLDCRPGLDAISLRCMQISMLCLNRKDQNPELPYRHLLCLRAPAARIMIYWDPSRAPYFGKSPIS